ncbi:alpha-glucosidase [Lactococcus termiticola]|uniref:Alpha-amylase n=1 Tax=Lactococcus termiticola TaxID=2169526 RepID=A0A2R5HKM4_9LACT|nr:alpha-glucosidase [Lactococcus termiticola]GBG97428.1 oligo-1,6-glucosidase [Lactococcus termiticola]
MAQEDFHKMVGYQIYPKSFKDSNGDGIGDIAGMIEKLDYLKDLGVDFLWINPIYKSPQVDGGYDIADFYAIDEMFGTMEDFKKFLKAAHARGLKVLLDLVVNHTSNQHPWFIEAQKSRDNPYRDYYLWADATKDKLPNDWMSFFGVPAWTYQAKTKQAYFHVFAPEQPDLNWKNPKLREEIYKMIRWWLGDVGIDGFRLDAISHIQKAPWDFKIKSWKGNGPWQPFMNVEGIDDYMKELKAIFDEYAALTVGEASGVTSDKASRWTGDGGYVNMLFELEHNARKSNGNGQGSIYGYKKVIMRWQKDMLEDGWNALYVENHDQPRVIDTFGDGSLASAKAMAVSYMLLRGTPFIYQGQEIGMRNFPFTDIKQTDAAEIAINYKKLLAEGLSKDEALAQVTQNARDHSRTPMQWDDSKNAGFTTGKAWFVINPNYPEVNVEKSGELIDLYKQLIALRHQEKAISDGGISFYFEKHRKLFAYQRDEFLVLCNLGETRANLNFPDEMGDYEQVLGSKRRAFTTKMKFDPWEYQVFKIKK